MAQTTVKRKKPGKEHVKSFLESYFSPRSLELNPILQNPSSVFVFDIESDGENFLVGYSSIASFSYHSTVVRDEQDLEVLFGKWIAFGYRLGYAFNLKYDLPTLLMHAQKYQYSHAIRNLGDFYFTRNYEVVRKKLFFELVRKPTHGELPAKLMFYDLLQFFQTSLEKAYHAFEPVFPPKFKLTEEEKKTWEEDKKKRGSIKDVTDEEVKYYNSLDVKVTAGLVHIASQNMRKLGDVIGKPMHMGITLPLTAEYAISSSLSMVDYRALDPRDRGDLYTALAISYRGGFFNSPKLGVFHEKLYKYDVNSMYPYMMTLIPELKYVRRIDHPKEDQIDSPFDLLCGQFSGNTAVPVKVNKQSLVLDKTFGCFWSFEVQPTRFAEWVYEATDKQMVIPQPYESLKIDHLYSMFKYEPGRHFPLRDVITNLYARRLDEKRKGRPFEKVIKIIMNSSYGKYGEMTFINPSKERLEYASLITAFGRVFINSLLPRDKIVTYLTDSIVSTEPLSDSIVGDQLGQLKEETPETYDTFLNVNNGVYSFMRDNNVLEDYTHTRGFSNRIGGERIGQKFFREYLRHVETATSPYQISIQTKKTIMVRTSFMNDVLLKNMNYVEVSTEDLQTRKIKGKLVTVPTTVKGFNTKYIYSPFHNGVSEGSIIKDYFTAHLVRLLFTLRDRGVYTTRVKFVPLAKERRNEVEIDCRSVESYRHTLPDVWNVMTVLCGEDHPIEKQVSLSAIKSFTMTNDKGELVRGLPIVYPPKRNFITNTAHTQIVRPPYKIHVAKGEDEGIDISDYLSDVIDQLPTNTSTENNQAVEEFSVDDLFFAIEEDIEEEDLSVEY